MADIVGIYGWTKGYTTDLFVRVNSNWRDCFTPEEAQERVKNLIDPNEYKRLGEAYIAGPTPANESDEPVLNLITGKWDGEEDHQMVSRS
jgi:hypothetical protein